MAVYRMDVDEILFFREAVRKNLHTTFASDSLSLQHALRSNIKIFRIKEVLRLNDAARRVGGIRNLSTTDTISFVQGLQPKVKVYDVADVISFAEIASSTITIDKLTFLETATVQKTKVIFDQLAFTEVIGLSLTRNLNVSETLILVNGLTGYKLDQSGATVDDPPHCPNPHEND